jgi:hypothetical protein
MENFQLKQRYQNGTVQEMNGTEKKIIHFAQMRGAE